MFEDHISDEDATPIACRACDGHFRLEHLSREGRQHITTFCRWCTRGAQSPSQLKRWQNHRRTQ